MSKTACLECNSSNLLKIDTYKRHWYFCQDCGSGAPIQKNFYPLQFLPVKDWTKTQADEESMYDYFIDPIHIAYSVDTAKEFIADYVNKWNIPTQGKTILDISAGNGHFINEFKKMGATVSMTEINDPSIEYAKKQHGIDVYKYNFNSDTLQNVIKTKFDIIMLRAAIMFCKDLGKHANDLKDIIAPDGLVVVNHSVIPTLGVILRTQVDEHSYFSLRSPEQVIKHFENAGFSLVERKDETDPSMYVYDHDLTLRWSLLRIFYELKAVLTMRSKGRVFAFPARDRRRSTMLFRYNG
jgi:ubiquinone/menaquinone biosynthesis C-methylase UbiE